MVEDEALSVTQKSIRVTSFTHYNIFNNVIGSNFAGAGASFCINKKATLLLRRPSNLKPKFYYSLMNFLVVLLLSDTK